MSDCKLWSKSFVTRYTVWFGLKWERATSGRRSGVGVEDGWGHVRGHTSVFFMLQIRSRCWWDYTTGVITHPTAPPPIHTHTVHMRTDTHTNTHTHKEVREVSQSSQPSIKLRGKRGAVVTDVMPLLNHPLLRKTELYENMLSVEVWCLKKKKSSDNLILQINPSNQFKNINKWNTRWHWRCLKVLL